MTNNTRRRDPVASSGRPDDTAGRPVGSPQPSAAEGPGTDVAARANSSTLAGALAGTDPKSQPGYAPAPSEDTDAAAHDGLTMTKPLQRVMPESAVEGAAPNAYVNIPVGSEPAIVDVKTGQPVNDPAKDGATEGQQEDDAQAQDGSSNDGKTTDA